MRDFRLLLNIPGYLIIMKEDEYMVAHNEIRLTEDQVADLWDRRISAEVRSLYFADLANVLSQRKQWMTGISFFLSSGAAATLLAKQPTWVAIVLSIVVALLAAYSFALNLDLKIKTYGKLHSSWGQLSADYARLWNHTYSDSAEQELDELIQRELALSELAAMDAPNDESRMERWQNRVFELYHLKTS
jgi:hypothetical protein